MQEPKKVIKVIKAFWKHEGSIIDEQRYTMLEHGDLVLVQLDKAPAGGAKIYRLGTSFPASRDQISRI
jgi:hypothetical protein